MKMPLFTVMPTDTNVRRLELDANVIANNHKFTFYSIFVSNTNLM